MGTFTPDTCLELLPKLSKEQVDREYQYFGGTVDLPTKDKRYKIREYLVNLKDAQTVPCPSSNSSVDHNTGNGANFAYSGGVDGTPIPNSSNNTSYSNNNNISAYQGQYQQSYKQYQSGEQYFDPNGQTHRPSNPHAEQQAQSGNHGSQSAVDMDMSGDDMELSDTENTDKPTRRPLLTNQPGAQPGPAHRGERALRGAPPHPDRGVPQSGGAPHLAARRGGVTPARGAGVGYPLPRGESNGRSDQWSRDGARVQAKPSRGGAVPSKRGMGFRGLGNKEEIPHNLKPIDWQNTVSREVFRVEYHEHTITKSRRPDEIKSFRTKHQMTVSEHCPNPILTFNEVSFPNAIKDVIRKNGFREPTPIQSQGWPVALSGRDLIGIAQTGSGKTLGFTLPGLIHVNAQPPGNEGPIALCLCPTRELAQQVMGVSEEFARAMRIRSVCLYGGSSKFQQVNKISSGVDFAIATPGRLIDLLDTGKVSLSRCSYLVLDEADRMLDMGFEPQITAIISQIRPDRQTLMWSATWPDEVQQLAQQFLTNPVQISIGSDKLVANHAIKQVVLVIEDFEKFGKLKELLKQIDEESRDSKTIIFTDTKRMADDIADELKRDRWAVESMHGDKRQDERERILRDFKRGYTAILVATDVASRGIDISDITHVINFDYPNTSEDYIHRIGRTARASRTGTAYTFITPNDSRNIDDLVDVLKEAGQEIPHALVMMKECFGGSKPEKKVWVPKAVKRRQDAQARDAERKRAAGEGRTSREGDGKDSDTEIETRKRDNWPETDDDWAALYGDMSGAGRS